MPTAAPNKGTKRKNVASALGPTTKRANLSSASKIPATKKPVVKNPNTASSATASNAVSSAANEQGTSYPLLSDDYIEDEAEKSMREQLDKLQIHMRPEAAKERRDQMKRNLLSLKRAGDLPNTSYDRLAVLPNGDIGQKNGQPLAKSSAPTPAASLAGTATSTLSHSQLERIFRQLGSAPFGWPVHWANLLGSLRLLHGLDTPISLEHFQAMIRSAKKKHLDSLERYLKLVQPWEQKSDEFPWNDFKLVASYAEDILCELFGVPLYQWNDLTNLALGEYFRKPGMTDRPWLPNKTTKDTGKKADLCKRKGGAEAAEGVESLRRGNNTDIIGVDERTGAGAIDRFRALIHYVEKSGKLCTDVESVFFHFGVRLGDMSFPEQEANLEKLWKIVKAHMPSRVSVKPEPS